jgi:hypothetical protein
MKKIIRVPLGEAKAGEMLGVDALDAKGNRLMAAGNQLTEETLKLLHRRGITHINLEREQNMTPEQIEIMQQEIEERLNRRFRNVQDSTQMRKFKSILLDYRIDA